MTAPEMRQTNVLKIREALMARGLSARSAQLYQRELWRIGRWCVANGWTLNNVPASALTAYVATRPATWSTRKLIRHSLIHYWAIAGRANPPVWALPIPRKPRMRCRALEPDEARTLAKAARARGDREGLAVLLALYVGLRREEISRLRWADVQDDGWLRIFGKGGTTAQLPMHPAVLHALSKLPRDSEWIFPGQHRGRPVVPTTVWLWIGQVGEQAGLEHVTPHRLRHTCLATANDNTGDLRAVQELARHSRPETTAGYTRVTAQRLKAVVASLDY
jgi:integrase